MNERKMNQQYQKQKDKWLKEIEKLKEENRQLLIKLSKCTTLESVREIREKDFNDIENIIINAFDNKADALLLFQRIKKLKKKIK